MNYFIPDSDIEEQTLPEFPVPGNLICKTEMNLNIKSLLLEKKTNKTLTRLFAQCKKKLEISLGLCHKEMLPTNKLLKLGAKFNKILQKCSQREGNVATSWTCLSA